MDLNVSLAHGIALCLGKPLSWGREGRVESREGGGREGGRREGGRDMQKIDGYRLQTVTEQFDKVIP